jgi:hypothetical protein
MMKERINAGCILLGAAIVLLAYLLSFLPLRLAWKGKVSEADHSIDDPDEEIEETACSVEEVEVLKSRGRSR